MIRNLTEYSTTYISGPAAEPVTIGEIRAALLLDLTEPTDGEELARWNATNTDLIGKARAARREAESILGKRIGEQVWDLTLNWWPCFDWRLPLEPVTAIGGVFYTDATGADHTLDPAYYAFSAASNRLWLKPGYYWPSVDLADYASVRIRLNVGIAPPAGDAEPAGIWAAIKTAILFRVGTFYAIREDMTIGTTMQASKVGTFEALLNAADRTIGV